MAIEKISIDIRSNAKEVEKELAKINSQIKKLEKEKINIRLDTKKLDAAEKKLDKLNTKLSGLSIKKAIIEVDTGDINEAANALGKLHKNIQQLSSIQIQTDISIRLSDVDLNMENIGSELQDQGLKLIKNITAVIEEGAAALQTASDKLPADIDSIIPKLTAMGAAIVGMGVLVGAAGAAATEFPKEAKTGFKMIREIGKLLIESAEVMDEISGKLPSDFGDFGSKLDGMNLAIAAMSVLVAAAGAAATEFPKEAKTGFKMIREIGKVLVESAEVIEEISGKLPSDFGDVAAKMVSMGIAIGSMGLLAGIAGAAATEFPKEAKTGFKMIREIGKALVESAEVIEEISGRLPSDFGDVAAKMASMGIAIGSMGLLAGIAGAAATKFPKEAKAGFKTINEISKVMIESAEALGEVATKVPSNFGDMASKMASMGIAIGGMGLLVGIAGKAAIEFPKEAKEGFSKILDINIVLQETAETMGQIAQKIPSDLGEMSSRLASMGIAILGMGALVGIAGKLATEFPEEAKEGLSKILDINIVLQETAETMEQIAQKIPSNLGEMSSRLASMGIAILGMGVLVGLAGKLATEFPEEAKEGFSKILDINIVLQETAETMEQIAQKIPSDLGEMSSRLASMGIAILGMGALVGIAGKLATEFPEEAKEGLSKILDINIVLQETAETMGQIAQKIPSDLGAMSSRLASMGIAIVGMGALVVIAGAVNKKFSKETKAGLAMISEVNVLLLDAANALGQINKKVPSDLGAMTSKLASMGIAIGGMSALVLIVGKFSESNPAAAVAGLFVVDEVIGLLMESAEAMKQIDKKVPGNIDKVASKLANIGIAIGGMSVLVGVVGALVASGIGALIAGAGLATVYLVAEELIHMSEAIKEMDQNVPEEMTGVKEKIEGIAEAVGYFTAADLGGVLDLLENAVGALNTAVAAEGIKKLVEVGLELEKLDGITIPENVEAKINEIQGVFKYLQKGVGFIKEFSQSINGGKVDTNIGEDAARAIGNLASVAKSIKELDKFNIKDPQAVEEKIKMLQDTFQHFTKTKGLWADIANFFDGGDIDADIAKEAANYVTNLVKIADQLAKIEKTTLNYGMVLSKLQVIQDVIKSFDSFDVTMKMDNQILTDTVSKSNLLSQLVEHLETIMNFKFDVGAVGRFKVTVQSIKDAIEEITSTDFTPRDENGARKEMPDWTWAMERDIQQAIDKLIQLNAMAEQLKIALDYTFDENTFGLFKGRMELMKNSIYDVLTTDFSPTNEDGSAVSFESWDILTSAITDAVGKLTQLNAMAEQLETALTFKFPEDIATQLGGTLTKLQTAVQMVSSFQLDGVGVSIAGTGTTDTEEGFQLPYLNSLQSPGNTSIGTNANQTSGVGSDFFGKQIENAKLKIEKINGLTQNINDIKVIEEDVLATKLSALGLALTQIREFLTNESVVSEAGEITSGTATFTTMMDTLEKLLPRFESFGTKFANHLLTPYTTLNPAGTITKDFATLITTLEGHESTFETIGLNYTTNLTEGLINAIKSIPTEINNIVDGFSTKNSSTITSFRNIGAELGNAIVTGFSSAVEGLYIKAGSSNNNESRILDIGSFQTGGIVPKYLATGGLASIFKKKGTDTIPAMLTSGEFVQRKAAVQTFGLDFMNRINNLDVRGVFATLTGRFSTQSMLIPAVSNVVNNINHTTNNANRVTQNVVGGNPAYMMKRASRYLR
ncbi:hypothetical protein IW492_01935 [Enterococcus sp. BWB1-3]|uniref:hypothetical protein n=1 Tax=Enterococcus sp. BWB1-3 TaxID=2787713 RepID=UPI001920FCE8|nr:hypothetical protein [Enterococcus sp. BWB1-3]MBL1227989.1 hypothetical protein [Enterococcus sp. BWB1-3]